MTEPVRVVRFTGATGATLVGRLHLTPGAPRAYALFAHCFTCGKDLKGAVRIASALAERGIATLRFDFTGLGESEGDFAEAGFTTRIEDLVAAADHLREHYAAPRVLIGHSLGGAAVLSAAAKISEADAVCTIAAPYDPAHVEQLLGGAREQVEEKGRAEVEIAGRRFEISKDFLDDLASQPARRTFAKLGKALLLFHSPQDQVVGIDNARLIYDAAKHPKSFVTLDGADHLLRRSKDSRYVAEVLAAWATRYLPEEPEEPLREDDEQHVVVEGGPSGLLQRVVAGGHVLWSDEPESVPGGSDRGPTPYGLLLAGLGACTSMTMRMYAERKGWKVDGIRVELEHGRVHAEDCADCESPKGKIDVIQKRVQVEGDLDEEQRARLVEIGGRCPVHRTLINEIKIRSEEPAAE